MSKKTKTVRRHYSGDTIEVEDKTEWHVSKSDSHQGLIIDTQTGNNIAVTYDKTHAPIIVRAVNMHEALVSLAIAAKREHLAANTQGENHLNCEVCKAMRHLSEVEAEQS